MIINNTFRSTTHYHQPAFNWGNLFGSLGRFGISIGLIAGYTGFLVNSFRRLTTEADRMAERFAGVNAPIAMAEARSEIINLMGEMRRAQRIAPELVRYIEARTAFQQKYEDAKVEFMNRVLPIVTTVMDVLTGILKMVTITAEVAIAAGGLLVPAALKEKFNALVAILRAILAAIAGAKPDEISDFTNLILGNIPAQHFFQGGEGQ